MTQKNQRNLLTIESTTLKSLCILGVLCVISGIAITLFRITFPTWLQLNLIAHSLLGGLALLPFSYYSYLHFRRTVGIRKAGVLFSGLAATSLFAIVFGTGIYLVSIGHQEVSKWVPNLHFLISYVVIAITVLHLILHQASASKKNKNREKNFITVEASALSKSLAISFCLYAVTIAAGTIAYTQLYQNPSKSIPDNYQTTYGSLPFAPSLTETENNLLIHVDQIAKSQQCAACHTDIYSEWLSSAHRQAASDPSYVKNISLLVKKNGIAAARYCEGCHAPVALLGGELTEGGSHGGIKNTTAHLEGVGCMGCHGIENVISTEGTASYHFSPKEHYLFDSASSRLGQKIRNFLIQSAPQKHKAAMSGDVLKDPKLCASCHEQFMDKSMNNWGWVKMQSTYQEWLESPFSGQDDQIHGDTSVMRCQDCHFPMVEGKDPSANQDGMIASHRSLGANTVLPTLNGDDRHLELTKRFLQSSKMLVHIEKPIPESGVTSDQFIDQTIRTSKQDSLPYFLYLEDTAKISITVTNRLVGHSFPAGTNDLNQAWLYFNVIDGNGKTIYSSGELNEELELDKNAHTYHTIPVDRQGKEVWKHDLFRMTGEVYKNVIPSGRSDIKSYQFSVPSWAKSPLTVDAVLKYRKFNQRYAKWALDAERPEIPVVDMARDTLSIPLKKRKSASSLGQSSF